MFGSKNKPEAGITLIANNCEMTGDVHFSDELLVNGVIKGNVYAMEGSRAVVRVSEKGRVKGEIRAPNIIINGKVYGDIHSDKHVELAAKAEVKGNVYYNLIEMVMGSRVDGNLVHVKAGKDAKADGRPDLPRINEAPREDRTAAKPATQANAVPTPQTKLAST